MIFELFSVRGIQADQFSKRMVGAVGNNAIRTGRLDFEYCHKFLSRSLIDIRPAVMVSEPSQDFYPLGAACFRTALDHRIDGFFPFGKAFDIRDERHAVTGSANSLKCRLVSP
jgi:hypothetical protein